MKAWGFLVLVSVLVLEGAQAVREPRQTQAGELCVEGTWSAITVLELQPGKVVRDLQQVRQATMKVHNLVCVPMEGWGVQEGGTGCGLGLGSGSGSGSGLGLGVGPGLGVKEAPVPILAGSGLAFVVLFPSTFTRQTHPLFANAPMPQLGFDVVLTRHREVAAGVWTGTMDRVVVDTTVWLLEASVVQALGMPKDMGGVLYLVNTSGQAAQRVLQAFSDQTSTGLGLTVANVSQFHGVASLGFDVGEGHMAPTCVPKVLPVFRFLLTDPFLPLSLTPQRLLTDEVVLLVFQGLCGVSALALGAGMGYRVWRELRGNVAENGGGSVDEQDMDALKAGGPPVQSRGRSKSRSRSRSMSMSSPTSVSTSQGTRTRKGTGTGNGIGPEAGVEDMHAAAVGVPVSGAHGNL